MKKKKKKKSCFKNFEVAEMYLQAANSFCRKKKRKKKKTGQTFGNLMSSNQALVHCVKRIPT